MAALARVERTDFLSPMCIGEVAHVSAEITYTSKHSVEVQVNVMSENILTGNFCTRLSKPAPLGPVPTAAVAHVDWGLALTLSMTDVLPFPAPPVTEILLASLFCRWGRVKQ